MTEDDSHQAPQWWRAAKFGIMVTWGPYAVPAFAQPTDSFFAFAEWYWFYQQLAPGELAGRQPQRDYHRRTFGAGVSYDDLVERWQAERWDPTSWIELFEAAGARYFVLVAKHHDGVALWPTSTSNRHTGVLGPKRDIVGDLLAAADGSSLRAGLFYAMAEWFTPAPHPDRLADPAVPLFDVAFNRQRRPRDAYTGRPVPYRGYRPVRDYAADHVIPQVTELVDRYRPAILWFDLPGDPDYYQSRRLVADFYAASAGHHPDGVAVNDRAGLGVPGDFRVFEYGHGSPSGDASTPFEACCSIGTSFGFNAAETAEHHRSSAALIEMLIDVVADGGNLLLNVGPRADGTIPPLQAERLRDIGNWLGVNGAAIYGSRPWPGPCDGRVRFTVGSDGIVYALAKPTADPQLRIDGVPAPSAGLRLLGYDGELSWRHDRGTLVVDLPATKIVRAPFVLHLGQSVA